ncbi:conserved hypothetical protein [Candida dubliniensis CD36]|uniref:Uncharacterized protein n=1 Tax=Candida dubliniensis (strain CD36 / ATCC MYA-646 / CBS 7987 / NCPF 3949 / NRRL Y-17841) TaxID=573826 RepID=B9W7M4_CANDC|nr:conserved hypothetical protein [Candida dubliniensis CD36]CAX44685.1 conserved hypothetical protein [Candida dubliniensis CD36]
MGFIDPGKSLRKRKSRSNSPLPAKIPRVSPSLSPRQYAPAIPKVCSLATLPVEIIHKIFVYVGPYENNLPLVEKHMNSILRFNGDIQVEPVYNYPLFKSMVNSYFLFDLNIRINHQCLQMKSKYYTSKLETIQQHHPEYTRSSYYNRLRRNLAIVESTVQSFNQNRHALLVDILNFKFVSSQVLYRLNQERETMGQGLLSIRSMSEITLLQKSRLKFLRLKFNEMGDNLKRLLSEIENGLIETSVTFDIESIQQSLFDEPEYDLNPHFQYFEDENLPTEGFSSCTNDRFIKISEGFINFNEGFEVIEEEAPGRSKIPELLFTKSIYSKRHYDTLSYLRRFYKFGKMDGPRIIISLSEVLESPHKYQVLNWLQLAGLVDYVCACNNPQYKFTEAIITSFRLFAHYNSKDHPLLFDIKIDIADAINKIFQMVETLVEYFFAHDHNNEERRQLWIEAMQLKSICLIDLLRKYDDNPDYDILHRFG